MLTTEHTEEETERETVFKFNVSSLNLFAKKTKREADLDMLLTANR
jgi:hypothetical protein